MRVSKYGYADLNITGVTVLSVAEYKEVADKVPVITGWWWLRYPDGVSNGLPYVDAEGYVGYHEKVSHLFENYIRPALTIEDLDASGLKIGDEFKMSGYAWTIVSEKFAICNEVIGWCRTANNSTPSWDENPVKIYIDSWWAANKGDIKTQIYM